MNNNEQVYEVENLDQKIAGLTGYVINHHLAKDRRTAERRMVTISIVFYILSAYFYAQAFNVI
jgi:hypothetical protein